MSFELKPMDLDQVRSLDIENIIMTHPRSPAPPLLGGRISDAAWARTFDAVMARYDEYFRTVKGLMPWIYIPCCIPCIFSKMIDIRKNFQREWLELVQNEQEAYRSVGIQVTLAKEVASSGVGSSRHFENETVGLRFEIGPMPECIVEAQGIVEAEATVYYQTMWRPGDDNIVAKLEKLAELHKTGALTDDEYSKAKSKLLQT